MEPLQTGPLILSRAHLEVKLQLVVDLSGNAGAREASANPPYQVEVHGGQVVRII